MVKMIRAAVVCISAFDREANVAPAKKRSIDMYGMIISGRNGMNSSQLQTNVGTSGRCEVIQLQVPYTRKKQAPSAAAHAADSQKEGRSLVVEFMPASASARSIR